MARILIVDDDVNFCIILKSYLVKKGFETDEAFSYQEAIRLLKGKLYDVILTDFRLPDKTGMELLADISKSNPESVVIIMTAYADIRLAVKAIKLGAYEFVTKPVNPDEIYMYIRNGLQKQTDDNIILERGFNPGRMRMQSQLFEYVYAGSKESKSIHNYIDLVAPTEMSVIIEGESGTGKEYIARKIHEQSKRKNQPFVAIDCGALSKELAGSEFFGHIKGSFTGAVNDKTGQFEAANGGTLFLDEIGNLSYEVQVKLLRAIQERKIRKIGSNKDINVNVRLITATNENLADAVKKGTFREDLYHRLNEFAIIVPPLRERKEDIRVFAEFFLVKANEELHKSVKTIPENMMEYFINYAWPGNIREVKNIIRRAVLLSEGDSIEKTSLPHEMVNGLIQDEKVTPDEHDLKGQAEKTEKEIIISMLQKTRYNKAKAARLLNIDRKTLYNKIKLYQIPTD